MQKNEIRISYKIHDTYQQLDELLDIFIAKLLIDNVGQKKNKNTNERSMITIVLYVHFIQVPVFVTTVVTTFTFELTKCNGSRFEISIFHIKKDRYKLLFFMFRDTNLTLRDRYRRNLTQVGLCDAKIRSRKLCKNWPLFYAIFQKSTVCIYRSIYLSLYPHLSSIFQLKALYVHVQSALNMRFSIQHSLNIFFSFKEPVFTIFLSPEKKSNVS